MFTRKVRLKINIASRQTVRLSGQRLRAHCPACVRDVELFTESEAARILEVDAVALRRLVADGYVHIIQTVSGSREVCKDSLFSR